VEHLTQKQIVDYSRRQIPAAELLSIADHTAGCEVCRRRIGGAQNGDAAFFELRSQVFEDIAETSTHLTPAQTAAYVDHDLSGEALQMASDHLTHCNECVLAVADLRAFRNEIAPSLDREYQPATVPVVPVKEGRRSVFGFLPFRVAPAPAFAGVTLAVLVLALIGWVVWRNRQQQPSPQIAETPTTPSQPAPQQPEPTPAQSQAAPVVVAQINDGSSALTLDKDGKLSGADNLPPNYQTLLKNALSSGRVEKSSQLQGLTRPPSSLMGANNDAHAFSVVEPMGTVLLTAQPRFRWAAMQGATSYVVEVYDESFNLVTSSPQLTTLDWITTTALPRGHTYSWQVKATTDGETITSPRPPAPQAKFRIVDQARANEIAKARRAFGSSHLTLGLLYADAGLLHEAEQEFRLLQKANPNSDLARDLLRQVQALRRSF
jgi:hypothetical protein